GELLSVKPIITMNEEGKLVVHQKVRARKKSLRYIADKTIQSLKSVENPEKQIVMVTHASDLEAAETVKALILDEVQPKEVLILNLGPTISSHTGYGCVVTFVRGKEGFR